MNHDSQTLQNLREDYEVCIPGNGSCNGIGHEWVYKQLGTIGVAHWADCNRCGAEAWPVEKEKS